MPSREAAELGEIIDKAVLDPASVSDLEVSYRRGHEMSGILAVQVDATGRVTVERSGRGSRNPRSAEAQLDPAEAAELFRAAAPLLDEQSSSRIIGDDEAPVVIDIRSGSRDHQILVWAGDVPERPGVHHLEALARRLADRLLPP